MDYRDENRRGDGGAILLSVTAACFLTTAGISVFYLISSPTAPLVSPVLILVPTFVVMTVIGLVVALIIGLPLTRWLDRRGLEHAWVYPIVGAAAGAGISLLLIEDGGNGARGSLFAAGFGALPGFLTGLFWWFSHRRHFQHRGD